MLKTTLAFLSLSLATALVGCGEEPIPVEPGFAADVRPIMVARCVRCHGAGGTLNADPVAVKLMVPTNGFFEQYADSGACGPMDPVGGCKRGALFYAKQKLIFTARLRSSEAIRMPPLPAEMLSEHQIQIIERWTNEATPKP